MLIEFRVKNFRSIKDEQVFSMLRAGKLKLSDNPSNISPGADTPYNLNLLKSAVIYGANASGKSNFLTAMSAIEYMVKESINFKLDEDILPYEPFMLDETMKKEPVEFEIDFINNKTRYIYKIIFNKKEFLYESLFFYPKTQKAKLFVRDKDKLISYGEHYKGSKRHELLKNQLLLSKAGATEIKCLADPYRFFSTYFCTHMIHGSSYDHALIRSFAQLMAKNTDSRLHQNMRILLKIADTGISDFTLAERNINNFKLPEEMSDKEKKELAEEYKYSIKTIHKIFKEKECTGKTDFKLGEESTGTIKLMAVGSLFLEALANGTTIIIDELDKSLHPKLTRALIQLFHSKKNNPHNAQLIFTTHDVSLIDIKLFRRDQIWLTEKNKFGCTEIFPLSDFTGLTKVKPLQNWYLIGRFGAVPEINECELDLDLP